MNNSLIRHIIIGVIFSSAISIGYCQPKGSLFIIGGGERSNELMKELVKTANMKSQDYVAILLMATTVPDQSYESIRNQLSGLCSNAIRGFNFNKEQANSQQSKIDSVQHAKLIYVVGGDQNRFMAIVKDTKLYHAIHTAYNEGATISGTSAGAAIMSQIMITGQERDSSDRNSFREIKKDNVITSQGMGLVTKAIIDQHFIRRSRYNRLLSVLADHPDKMVIGVDESTALIVKGDEVRVAGDNQVVVVSNPENVKESGGARVSFKNARLSLFTAGEAFKMK